MEEGCMESQGPQHTGELENEDEEEEEKEKRDKKKEETTKEEKKKKTRRRVNKHKFSYFNTTE